MNGKEDWAKFAEENGITWEEGPCHSRDQYGNEYETFIWALGQNDRLLDYLRRTNTKHVIVRMFPHKAEKEGLVRMRFSGLPEKPQ